MSIVRYPRWRPRAHPKKPAGVVPLAKAAELLKKSASSVRRYILKGELVARQDEETRKIYITRESIEALKLSWKGA